VVGVIGRPHGLRGEVLVELRTDEPERRFAPGQRLRAEGQPTAYVVASARDHGNRLLVRFEGLADRTAVEAVRGTVLVADIDPAERPVTEDEFYDRQLIGLRVRGQPADLGARGRDADLGVRGHDADLGRVIAVLHLPEQDLLEVQTPAGVRLVPFVAALVPDVDLTAGILTVAEVTGLLEDEPDT
jgi:16S rRNA processing protein RimM